jgi:hypothetical protein
MGGPTGATGQLETPWVQALTACCGVEPINLFQQLPEYDNHDEFQESGLYLFTNALNAAVAGNLTQKLKPIFHDIYNVEFRSKVANNKSFQAVSSKRCSCRYNYTGEETQLLYRRGGNICSLQPPSVTRFFDDIFSVFEEWSEGAYSMISRGQNLRCFCELLFPTY